MTSEDNASALAALRPEDRVVVRSLVGGLRSGARVPIFFVCGRNDAVGPVVDAVVSATGAERVNLADWIGRSADVGWRRPDEILPHAVGEIGRSPGGVVVLDDAQPVARTTAGWSFTSLRAVLLRKVSRPVVLVFRAEGCDQLKETLEGDGRRRVFVVGARGGRET